MKSWKSTGIRVGNWLSQKQAQALLSAPDISTVRGLRDRAILAVFLSCGLRRSEVAALTFAHVQQRDGRYAMLARAVTGRPLGASSTWSGSTAAFGLRRCRLGCRRQLISEDTD